MPDLQSKSALDSDNLQVVRHEAAQEMRVWPLGVGLQEQASKHLKLQWSKAMVVSVEEKVPLDGISCGPERRAQANHPMRCRKIKDDVKTGGHLYTRISPGPAYCLGGVRHRGGVTLIWARVWNVGTLHVMLRENPISVDHEGGKYQCT